MVQQRVFDDGVELRLDHAECTQPGRQSQPGVRPQARYWPVFVGTALFFGFAWSITLLTYLLPPALRINMNNHKNHNNQILNNH